MFRVAQQAVGLAAARLALGGSGFGAALAAGAERNPAAVGLAFGAGASAVALVSDRRFLLFEQPTVEPLPAAAEPVGPGRAIRDGLLPSTAGVALLLAISLGFKPILSAVLAGVLLGMGLVTVMSVTELTLRERREARRYYADFSERSRRYVGPR
ncbi:MAG TPA: hypothetical protein VFU26_10440 [Gaiellaceae bacterium]|nr:hypothetical protein [Gaiellaceae bacterium]